MLKEVYLISLHSSFKEYRNIKLFHTFLSITFNCKSIPPLYSLEVDRDGGAVKRYGYISARTDTTQQINICLGIHFQTCVANFNPTCLFRLIPTTIFLFLYALIISDVAFTWCTRLLIMIIGMNFCLLSVLCLNECDLEPSTTRRPRPNRPVKPWKILLLCHTSYV